MVTPVRFRRTVLIKRGRSGINCLEQIFYNTNPFPVILINTLIQAKPSDFYPLFPYKGNLPNGYSGSCSTVNSSLFPARVGWTRCFVSQIVQKFAFIQSGESAKVDGGDLDLQTLRYSLYKYYKSLTGSQNETEVTTGLLQEEKQLWW